MNLDFTVFSIFDSLAAPSLPAWVAGICETEGAIIYQEQSLDASGWRK